MPFDPLLTVPIFGPILTAGRAVFGSAPDLRDVASNVTNIVTGRPEPEPVITVVNQPDPLTNYYRIATLALAATGLTVSIIALTRSK